MMCAVAPRFKLVVIPKSVKLLEESAIVCAHAVGVADGLRFIQNVDWTAEGGRPHMNSFTVCDVP